ncbi:MAG: hypothetical protein JWN80_122 [Microbacteriaceae bacterium]|jgi:hypothetical protein|nr:hypothetical protein [Microbacteriaceae bacterium]
MIGLLALAGIAIWAIVATIEAVRRDGYHRIPDRPDL